MSKVKIEINENDLKKLVVNYLENLLGMELKEEDVCIEVKSKQNYKSEWERANFRAIIDKSI